MGFKLPNAESRDLKGKWHKSKLIKRWVDLTKGGWAGEIPLIELTRTNTRFAFHVFWEDIDLIFKIFKN